MSEMNYDDNINQLVEFIDLRVIERTNAMLELRNCFLCILINHQQFDGLA